MEMDSGSDSPARLLRDIQWVRRLAGVLVRDGADADDVAQEAWVHALSEGRGAGVGRGWLGAVVRNAARGRGRREARRREVEPEAARDVALPPDDELAARASAQPAVVDHVLALAPAYRRVVLLRFFEGLTPTEIAARDATPLATVKTRLARGIERLRERLDAAHGGRRKAWVQLLAPLSSQAAAATVGSVGLGLGVTVMGSKFVATVTLAGALVLAGGLWWQQRDGDEPAHGVTRVAGAAVEAPLEIEPPPERAEAPSARDVPEELASHEPPPERAAAAETPAPAKLAIEVRVVDDTTGAPVEGARVYALGAAALERLERPAPGTWSDPIDLLVGAVAPRATGADGGLAIALDELAGDGASTPRAPGSSGATGQDGGAGSTRAMAAAILDDRVGIASFEAEDGATVELRLVASRALRFRTVDEHGAPLPGVPVGLCIGPGAPPEFAATTEGPDALGEFAHFEAYFGELFESGMPMRLALPFPTPEPVEVPVDDAALADVVTLVVPPTGRLAIDVRDELGRPLDGERVRLQAIPAGVGFPLATRSMTTADALSVDGVAEFPRVGLGLAIGATLEPAVGPGRTGRARAETSIDGPTEPGELVRATLAYAGDAAVLVGRLVDVDGTPLEPGSVRIDLTVRDASFGEEINAGMAEARIDADGRFRAAPDEMTAVRSPVEARGPGRVLLRVPATGGEDTLAGSVPLTFPLPRGLTDVGDVVVALPPAAFQGRVVDADGAPIEGARVFASRLEDGRTSWVTGAETNSRGDGAFALRADLAPGSYRLHASAKGYLLADPTPAKVGATGIDVEMLASGSVAGRVTVADGVPVERLRVEVASIELERDWPSQPSRAIDQPKKGGAFELRTVYPGRSLLTVHLPGVDAPILSRELVVAAGKNDVGALDVAASVRPVALAIRDADGRPVPRGYATVTAGGATLRAEFVGGELSLLVPTLPVDVELRANGFLPLVVRDLSAGQAVVLRPAGFARVALPADLRPLPESLELRVVVLPAGEASALADALLVFADGTTELPAGFHWRAGAVPVSATAPAEVALQEPGAYVASWSVRAADGRSGGMWLEGRTAVELAPGATVTAGPDPGELADALERLAD